MSQNLTTREERESKHFDKLARECGYAWWGSQTLAAKMRIQRRINLIKKILPLKAGDKILECGCGTGDFTLDVSNALDEKIFIYAIDLSEAQIDVAKNKIKKQNINFIVDSLTKMTFEDSYFDFVVGNAILHHLDVYNALKEIKRVLKSGGRLLFFEPNMANPQIWLSLNIKPFREFYQASPDETAFWHWEIKKTLLSLDFKNVMVKPFDFIHPLIPKSFLDIAKKTENILEKTFFNEIAGSLIITAEK